MAIDGIILTCLMELWPPCFVNNCLLLFFKSSFEKLLIGSFYYVKTLIHTHKLSHESTYLVFYFLVIK